MRLCRLAAVVIMAAPLAGCVAAAVPVMAAGAIAGKRQKAKSEPVSAKRRTEGSTRSDSGRGEEFTILPLKELPPPDGKSVSVFDDFEAYVLAQHARGNGGHKRDSAVMAPDSTLSAPTVVPCDARPTAVLVDSDARDAGAPAARALTSLRNAGVRVLWALNAGDAESAAPTFLNDAGFAVGDVVLRSPSPVLRKQTVRQLATVQHCIVAIAGRRRSDMDELYDYLRDPATVVPSDVLWNRGWFLIPAKPDLRPASKGTP